MSIPPLVCSTPPPPDQCEDDKDPEDFDIQYNLSQDEEDDNYDYGNFTNYNHFQSSSSKVDVPVITKDIEIDKDEDISNINTGSVEQIPGTNITSNSESKLEEETNIEDLDLKIDEETLETTMVLESKDSCAENIPSSDCENIQISRDASLPDFNSPSVESNELTIEPHLDQADVDETTHVPVAVSESKDHIDVTENVAIEQEPLQETKLKEFEERTNVADDDDDFGDFDDFKVANSASKPPTLDICDNPWDNTESPEGDFGDFKANFDSNESDLFSSEVKPEHSTEVCTIEDKVEGTEANDDDGFGDFNDFQSSSVESRVNAEGEESLEDQMPTLYLEINDDEDKLMLHVNREINKMFEDELPEIEEFKGKTLEAQLGVTWGHLLETEVRQPYMVNWNNSVGQKTLLKALCIDSRNILFGPKWNYSMPKYAANLGMTPLQPLKQNATISSQIESSSEKTTSSASTWRDPFTSEGQQSRNPERATVTPGIEARNTDLDVFEASTSSKPDKVFSSTLNVQPIRQISLPDTHIFTPTDSETPRSTTIHYDASPTVLLPQTLIPSSKSDPTFKCEPKALPPQCSTKAGADDDDYWEFQDFKGTTDTKVPSATSLVPEKTELPKSTTSNITHGTQLLQPIKIEPTIPTLNWPDPGHVKETFDDFSDFISSTSLSSQIQQSPDVPTQQTASKPDIPSTSGTVPTVKTTNDKNDDDFDTFQSAFPSTSSVDFNFTTVSSKSSPQVAPQPVANFDHTFPKMYNKSETISYENIKPNDGFAQDEMSVFPANLESNKPPEFTALTSQPTTNPLMMATSLLQPTSVTSNVTQSQQKSAQILQPLSLESFSQINWPNPGIDLQDLSRFNPVETLHSLKTDLSVNSQSKVASPVSSKKNVGSSQASDDDWGEFVSSKPKPQQAMPNNQTCIDDDEWTDFVSSPSVKPQNGLNTISLNVHTNLNIQKSSKFATKSNKPPIDIPSLNYITPKAGNHKAYNDRHFQNL